MARVLISSIGEGRRQTDGSYAYDNAKYFLADSDPVHIVESPLIVSALIELYNIDKLIIIGTSGSDWASLYAHLYIGDDSNMQANNNEYDDDYYTKLSGIFNESKSNPPILVSIEEMQRDLLPLKDAIGDFCDSIWVMQYGINEHELNENFLKMNDVATRLNDGDELYFDISHSFRSLPFYELLVMNLAKQIKGKKLEIKAITYGMFTSQSLFDGLTPIVNLSQLVNITEWMKAVEEFDRFGTAHLISELIESSSLGLVLDKDEQNALKRLGQMATGIKTEEFKNLVKNCVKITNKTTDLDYAQNLDSTKIVLGHIFWKISVTFGSHLENDAKLFAELSKWHFVHKRYITSVITLDECLFDFFAALIGVNRAHRNWDWNNNEIPFRNKVYNARSDNDRVMNFLFSFRRLNEIRNHLAHGGHLDYKVKYLPYYTDGMRSSVEEQLDYYTKHFSTEISNFQNNDSDLEDLRKAILQASDSRYANY